MTYLPEALKASATDRDSYRPLIFRPALQQDATALEALLERNHPITVVDHLHGQLEELVRVLNPSKRFGPEELAEAAVAHLNGAPAWSYGAWVFYPWSARLVHLLDGPEFAMVRTDRNRNKITREEQAVLAGKKVGVIGLSVGQSVALAMTLERGYGEIRLADFDTLELSNLNRIRSGVQEMGIKKVINTAREIAEIDPFLKVVCYPEGITSSNLNAFLTDEAPLDLLIEECDSPDIKILARLRCRDLGIPLVMDTSDRGLIDLERYDLEPHRSIAHGLLDGLDLSVAENGMTPAQKFEYIMTMVGKETLSTRMKATLPEIGRTVLTWPQLGAHVTLGGALTAEIARKVALGQMEWSGRWWIDLDELLTAERSSVSSIKVVPDPNTQD